MKKKSPRKIIITLSVFLFFSIHSFAQTKTKNLNYSKSPYWIDMMNDPNANYFETIKAYNAFWEKRKKPNEENDIIGQDKSANKKQTLLQRWFKTKEQREEEESRKYALDVKKFEHWKMVVKPYVQEDGRILNAEEKLRLWKEQQNK
ncbi:MAG: hypothetical protein ACXVPU_13460 [Bacteroidia bacterium]